jgi:hypothetical protein
VGQERDKHHQDKQSTHGSEHPSQRRDINWPSVYPIKIEPATEDNERYSDEKKGRWKQIKIAKILNLITFGAAAVGLLGLAYLRGQLGIMKGQLDNMNDALKLQRQIAAAQHGGASVEIRGISIYHDAKGVTAGVQLQNNGSIEASQIAIASKIGFGDSCPSINIPSFENLEEGTNDTRLLPYRQKPEVANSPHRIFSPFPRLGLENSNVYIWGVIRYTDFWKVTITDPFCKFIPTKIALNSLPGTNGYVGCYVDENNQTKCYQ